MDTSYKLTHCCWQDDRGSLSSVRRTVFIEEQHVPEALELDELDAGCHHVLVVSAEKQPVGAARISAAGQIGRMAVLKAYRRQGIGSALLVALLEYAVREKYVNVYLHAQLTAIPFYEKHGFSIDGEEFMDAEILHRKMVLKFAATESL